MVIFYLLVVHLVAVAAWVGGMLANALALLALPDGGPAPALATVRRFDRRFALPAMVLVWATGLVLAVWWLRAPWLWLKLALVVALTALHAKQSVTLRGLQAGVPAPAALQLAAPAILLALAAIALVTALKPF